jgi:hypothetical protein
MPSDDVFWPATRNDIHWGIWSAWALIALVTLGRTAAGAVSEIHAVWVLVIVAGVLGCSLLTWWWSLPQACAGSARRQIARGGIGVCPALVLGVVLAGTSWGALIGVLSVTVCGLAFVIVRAQQLGSSGASSQVVPSEPANDLTLTTTGPAPAAGAFDDPLVRQQMIRRRTESGGDSLEALLRVEFAANQREASIHVPIQPAFAGMPEVECEPLDEAEVHLKVAAVHPYGVRIEAKRGGDLEEPATIAVGILMQSAGAAAAAA